MLLNKLPNDRVAVELKTSLHKFIEETGQRDLGNFQKDIDILREAGSTTKHRRQAPEQGIANVVFLEHLAENFDRGDEITGQVLRGFRHVALQTE